MFVGESLGREEVRLGKPFVGDAGEILADILIDLNWLNGIWLTNLCKCKPPGNRNPSIEEGDTCGDFLLEEIKIIEPRGIVCLGRVATEFFLRRLNRSMSGSLRGKQFRFNSTPVLCTWHPAAHLYDKSGTKKPELQTDIKLARQIFSKSLPWK